MSYPEILVGEDLAENDTRIRMICNTILEYAKKHNVYCEAKTAGANFFLKCDSVDLLFFYDRKNLTVVSKKLAEPLKGISTAEVIDIRTCTKFSLWLYEKYVNFKDTEEAFDDFYNKEY